MTPQQINQSNNHPKEGDIIAADPLKTTEEVLLVKDYVKRSIRDYALFILGINTNLRASDIVRLTVGDVIDGQVCIREKKTKKKRLFRLNEITRQAIAPLLGREEGEALFASRKGGSLSIPALSRLVKLWCERSGLKGNYSSHTLRKTWAYFQYYHAKRDLAEISHQLNHSSMRTTYNYLGITPDVVKEMYEYEIGRG
jgi:integrase